MARKLTTTTGQEELIKGFAVLRKRNTALFGTGFAEEKLIFLSILTRDANEMFPNEMAGKPFRFEETKTKYGDKSSDELLIEGDNYHSLAF